MKKHYFFTLLQVAYFMIFSLFLQNCGGSGNLPVQREEGPSAITTIEQEEGEEQGISSFDISPSELWQEIFSYLDFEGVLAARAVNSDWNELITGYREAGVVGVENKPSHIVNARDWMSKKIIYFHCDKLRTINSKSMPSFAFYLLMGKVRNLHPEFWPYLQETQVYTVDLSWNKIGDQGAEEFAKCLQGTRVHTVHLSGNEIGAQGAVGFAKYLQATRVHTIDLTGNKIGDQGVEEFAKYLQGTRVHTVYLSGNHMGDQGAEGFAKHLQGTRVHTVDLSWNEIRTRGAVESAKYLQGTCVHTVNLESNKIGYRGVAVAELAKHLQGTRVHTVNLRRNKIGDQGAEEFAKHLQGTQVHTVNLNGNQISADVQRLLVEEYPHINWTF
jgi:Ran GTPase-activating protein (RanGAP) involved in mRNA processing and transport